MRKFFKTLLKICKWILIVLLIVILLFFIVRFIGQRINSRTPEGGINETMFVDINGTKQWISIYGQDRDNPVLLYLHGGPCGPTSAWDWQVFRRISDVYTVVNWDQRGCGHNYPDYKEPAPINAEIMLADGKAMTDFLCEHLQKEQITLYGNSWGSIFAANLALDHPEKYEKLIVSALVVDEEISRDAFRSYLLEQSSDDPEIHAAAEQFDPAVGLTAQEDLLMKLAFSKYIYADDILHDTEFNWFTAYYFNPYCTLPEIYRSLFYPPELDAYTEMLLDGHPFGDVLCGEIPISGRTAYQMPFYLIEGDKDHGVSTMVEVAADYYEQVQAPDKAIFYNTGGHGSTMLRCDQLSDHIHVIADRQP